MAFVSPFSLLASICFLFVTVHSLKQEIILYETPQDSANVSESSPHMVFNGNSRNITSALESSSPATGGTFKNSTGACTNGTWMVYPESDYGSNNNTGGVLLTAITASSTSSSRQCFNMTGKPIKSIRHAGHSDLAMPALSLYDNESMAAGRELYFEGYRLVLPKPIEFGSYGFTGSQPWCVSPVEITEGSKNVCLELPQHDDAQLNATGGNILTYRERSKRSVQEIRAGCAGTEVEKIYPEYNMTALMVGNETNITHAMPMPPAAAMMGMNSSGIRLELGLMGNTNSMVNVGNLTFIGTKLRLVTPFMLVNYTFMGEPATNWTLYSDVFGTLDRKCLIHGTIRNGTAEQIQVGAIELGCDMKSGASGSGATVFQFTASVLMILFTYALY